MSSINPLYAQYTNIYELDRDMDSFYSSHRANYEKFDFVQPIIAIIKKARSKYDLNFEEKKRWVISMHNQLVQRSYGNTTEKTIALASGPHLVHLFAGENCSVYSRNSLLFYNLIKFSEVDDIDVDHFIKVALEKCSEDLKQKNPISLIEIIRDTNQLYLGNDSKTIITLAEKALGQIDWEHKEKELFRWMLPHVLNGMQCSSSLLLSLQNPPNPNLNQCCCIVT